MRPIDEIKADMRRESYAGHTAEAIVFNRELTKAEKEIELWWNTLTLERKSELYAAERDGRCVVLPCKVGEELFHNFSRGVENGRVRRFQYNNDGLFMVNRFGAWKESEIGKTVFLTCEAAALAQEGKQP